MLDLETMEDDMHDCIVSIDQAIKEVERTADEKGTPAHDQAVQNLRLQLCNSRRTILAYDEDDVAPKTMMREIMDQLHTREEQAKHLLGASALTLVRA